MIRPFTCLCMLAAAGAGLYLYQEKYRAQLLDREISTVIKQIDQSHDRINMLKAEWALLNQPDRLSSLAQQHLSLQPLAPGQFAQLADLGSRLPPPAAPDATPPASVPMAQAAPPVTVAAADVDDDDDASADAPLTPKPVMATAAMPAPAARTPAHPAPKVEMAAAAQHPPVLPHAPAHPVAGATDAALDATVTALRPAAPAAPLQLAAARPLQPRRPLVRKRPEEAQLAVAERPHPYQPLYAPVMSAFASGASAQAVHLPTVQRAAAGFTEPPRTTYGGSSLGMAAGSLAPPVPISGER